MTNLDFNIISTGDCSRIEFQNCSTYCIGTSYTHDYLIGSCYAVEILGFTSTTAKVKLYSLVQTSGTVSTYSWTFGTTTITTADATFSFPLNTISTVTLVVTDSNGLTSTNTMKINVGAEGADLNWFVSPSVSISPGPNTTLSVYFANNSYVETTTVNTTTDLLDFGDSSTTTIIPASHTYTSTGTKSLVYSFDESIDGESVNVEFQYKLTPTTTDCQNQLTTTNIDSVELHITDPDGITETVDITNSFFNAPFYILQKDLNKVNFTNSGIWEFLVEVIKTDGNTYIFSRCKKIVIICDIKCKYDKLLSSKTGIDKDCVDCEEITLNQIFNISIFLSALKDDIACLDTAAINNKITILKALVANTDCDCS
ncbi:MAG: hypothetical protein KatS3mg002_1380 [Candidatus Woesearchaeota archaeon]|nr:MAG: hypothetical protein KatS3mg002_1380 [Candidatus Woesearchaeota archaeon]